jgi:hypothetical protein
MFLIIRYCGQWINVDSVGAKMLIHTCNPLTMRALKHVFALHETCVVATSSTACCATVVAHVIFKLHPFAIVLAQGPFAVQTDHVTHGE